MLNWKEKLMALTVLVLLIGALIGLARCTKVEAAELPGRCDQYRAGVEQAAVGRCPAISIASKGAQIMVESSCRDNARSSVGARYATQIMPATERWFVGFDAMARSLPRGSRERGLSIQAGYLCLVYWDVSRHRPPTVDDHCRLAWAAYHSGPGGIATAVRRAGASSWEAIKPRLGRYGRAYPDSVLGRVPAFRLLGWPTEGC